MLLHAIALIAAAVVSIVPLAGQVEIQPASKWSLADLGRVSANLPPSRSGVQIVRKSNSYVVKTAIGLRITADGTPGSVSLQAYMDSPASMITIRLDGVQLSALPRVFATNVSTDTLTRHNLEIEIPNNLDPAQIPSDIQIEFATLGG